MDIFIIAVLFLVVLFLWWINGENSKRVRQNRSALQQSQNNAIIYSNLFYELAQKNKLAKEDYIKVVASLWNVDGWLLDYREFNNKWTKFCTALGIEPEFEDKEDKTHLSE